MAKIHNKNRQDFLLSFFNDEGYQEKEVNGFYLVKQWNGNNKSWQVAIYPKQSYENMKRQHAKFQQFSLKKFN